ncbi:MAG: hypothetical protein ACP5VS_07740 [Desulfomonilaceae bacterium]
MVGVFQALKAKPAVSTAGMPELDEWKFGKIEEIKLVNYFRFIFQPEISGFDLSDITNPKRFRL